MIVEHMILLQTMRRKVKSINTAKDLENVDPSTVHQNLCSYILAET